MRLLRVFPRRTKATPIDELAVVGEPGLFPPDVDEVHISVTFTWDIERGHQLKEAWERIYPGRVKIGGPALGDPGNGFIPGQYLRPGYTITSRGCPNRCDFCLVPKREGHIRELRPIAIGNDVLDNNLLACSDEHIGHVLAMLSARPRAARFSGGLEAVRCTPAMVERLRTIRIRELFLAYDRAGAWPVVLSAIERFRTAGLSQRQVRCYVLAGYEEADSPEDTEERCREVLGAGALPFCMLFQPADAFREYGKAWKALQRKWTRPAAMLARQGARAELVTEGGG